MTTFALQLLAAALVALMVMAVTPATSGVPEMTPLDVAESQTGRPGIV